MSQDIRSESDRRTAELESLVAGLAKHVDKLEDDLDACHNFNDSLTFELAQAAWKLRRAEEKLEAMKWPDPPREPQEC